MTGWSELNREECLELLGRARVGRVGLCTPMGPRVFPVNYSVHEGEIFFRTTPYSELGTHARDNEVAFEVDELDQVARTGASALALGRAEAVESHEELHRLHVEEDPAPWAKGPRHLVLRIRITQLTGRRISRGHEGSHEPA